MLSPGFFDNPDLAELPPHTRLLFAGLWCHCDREGRCVDDPRRIRAAVFPYETGLDVDAMLTELARAGFIDRYEISGQALICVPGFLEHQQPHKNETASVLPPPLDGSPKDSQRTTKGNTCHPVSIPVPVPVPVPVSVCPTTENAPTPRGDLAIVGGEYERMTGHTVPGTTLVALCADHPTDRCIEAIGRGVRAGKTSLSYIAGIARGLAAEGWTAPPALTAVPDPFFGLCGEKAQA